MGARNINLVYFFGPANFSLFTQTHIMYLIWFAISGVVGSTTIANITIMATGSDTRILNDGLQEISLQRKRGLTVWMTGLSGSGKTTLASQLEKRYPNQIYRLDGDNLRQGLNEDLGFSIEDRTENNRRTMEVAKLFNDSGKIVISALIAPFTKDRALARKVHQDSNLDFIEVFVNAPLSVVESRDTKGLYKKAREGVIPEFTGVSSPYEEPTSAEVQIDTHLHSVEESIEILLNAIRTLTQLQDEGCIPIQGKCIRDTE